MFLCDLEKQRSDNETLLVAEPTLNSEEQSEINLGNKN